MTPGLIEVSICTVWSRLMKTSTVCSVSVELAFAEPTVAPEKSPAAMVPSAVATAARRRLMDM